MLVSFSFGNILKTLICLLLQACLRDSRGKSTLNDLFPHADQIALPDFNAGAMENWGLITYRETALLYDEAFSSNSNKERIATIISHELAHMVRL